MASPDHKVRVFISSTFRDMHAERDHLVTVVFPELRERCERLGLEFFDVDLRWGVPDKNVDGESANSWEYCRKWINEAKPFFICLLGQRYGWEPEPHQLKEETDQQAQAASRRSITDMEVHHALENDAHSRRCYFYLRQAQAPATATEFVDPPPLLVKLDALKARVETCGRPVWHYPCRWSGSGFTDMEAFGKKVLEDLWSGILRDSRYVSQEAWQQVLGTDPAKDLRCTDESQHVPDDLAEKLITLAKPPPKTEREQMQRFAESRLKGFQGREQELKELLQFIAAPAEAHDTPRLALIAAQPGQGKSALMAKLWENIQPQEDAEKAKDSDSPRLPISESPSLFVICHFVGATEKSSTAYHLVKRLNDELDNSGITFPVRPTPEGQPKEEPKLDFQSLCQRLWDRLGDYAGEKRIVILLDALNQIDDGHDLGWLPYRLGPSVRVVVSCIEEAGKKMEGKNNSGNLSATHFSASNAEASPATKVLTALDSRHPKPKRIPLGPLNPDDIRTIVTSYLKEYCKELDALHVDAICDETKLPQARNPLYLLVLLAELRTLGGNDMNQHVPALIADMGRQHPDTVSLFHWVLERLEQAEGFGEAAVRCWCLYLALGRVGMSSRELSDLLIRKLGPDSAATAQRIERALRRYLQRRGEQWDFFHGQLRQAVIQYWSEDSMTARLDIAHYFDTLADPEANGSWIGGHLRYFAELSFQLNRAGQIDALDSLLGDLVFAAAKAARGGAFDLLNDYHERTTIARSDSKPMPDAVAQISHIAGREASGLHRHPSAAVSQFVLGVAALNGPVKTLATAAQALCCGQLSLPGVDPAVRPLVPEHSMSDMRILPMLDEAAIDVCLLTERGVFIRREGGSWLELNYDLQLLSEGFMGAASITAAASESSALVLGVGGVLFGWCHWPNQALVPRRMATGAYHGSLFHRHSVTESRQAIEKLAISSSGQRILVSSSNGLVTTLSVDGPMKPPGWQIDARIVALWFAEETAMVVDEWGQLHCQQWTGQGDEAAADWRVQFVSDCRPCRTACGVGGGACLATSKGELVCVDEATHELWRVKVSCEITCLAEAITEGVILAGLSGGELLALNASDGSERLRVKVGSSAVTSIQWRDSTGIVLVSDANRRYSLMRWRDIASDDRNLFRRWPSAHPVLTARWSAQCGCLDIITSIGERVSIERHPPLHTAPSGACVDWRLKQEPSLPASLTDAWQMPDGEIIALMRESDRSVISRFKQVPDSSLTNISLWSGGAGWLRQQPLFLHDAAISPGGHALVATQSLPGASVLGLGRFKVRSLNFHWATMPRNVGYLSVADDGCTWACLAECEKSSPWLRLCCRGHSYDLMKSLTSHTSETERGLTWLCHQVMDAHGRNILALDDKGAAWLFKFDPAKPDIRPQAHALEVHAIACALSPCASSAALLLPDNAVRLFNLEGGRLMPITTLLLRSRPSFIAIAHNHELVAGGQGWVIAVEF